MDFSSAGLKTGVQDGAKVALWVAGSGAVAALIAYLGNVEVQPDQVEATLAITVANAVLVFLKKWLETSTPKK